MNKLEGFFLLREMNIPTIPWKEYTGVEKFDKRCLWTVRTAVLKGLDVSLPRIVGANALQAEEFAKKTYRQYKNKGMVLYYPYFIAEKSGTLEINNQYILLEAVEKDLWNLVTRGSPKVSLKWIHRKEHFIFGEENFLSKKEKDEILSYIPEIKRKCNNILLNAKSVLLEWSYAFYQEEKNIEKKNLIFYEIKEIYSQ